MSDTLLTDLSIHIHDNPLGQDILRCTDMDGLRYSTDDPYY